MPPGAAVPAAAAVAGVSGSCHSAAAAAAAMGASPTAVGTMGMGPVMNTHQESNVSKN